MPSVPYMNQSASFWEFLAGLEHQGPQHPSFSQSRTTGNEHESQQEHGDQAAPQPSFTPWGWSQFLGGPGGMPHRGPSPHGASPHPHNNDGEAEKAHQEESGDKDAEMNDDNDNDNGEGPSGNQGSDNEGRPHGLSHHGRCGGKRHGRCGPGGPCGFGPRYGPPHHGPGPQGHHNGGRGPRGPRGRHGPWGGFGGGPFGGIFDPSTFGGASFDPANVAAQFWNHFSDSHPTKNNHEHTPETTQDYIPDADVFDTETAFVVHISLPGAKKEDVGVNWDAEKSELSVAGVIYRPGDEEFLKTLALSERKVGPFERKVRLGTRATPAHVDADGITAKLEDGVLRIEVPKLDSGYVEIRKVDIE